MGAMIIKGIAPGTAVMVKEPTLFWGLVASMWVGNLMLIIINLPLIGLWVKLLQIPYRWLFPAILVFCCVGVYSVGNSYVAVLLTAGFTVLGYVAAKLGCECAPFLLGFVLGPLMEENLRRSMLLSNGDPLILIQRPISAVLIACALGLLVLTVIPSIQKTREEAFQE
jgi:TctA family transporter